jgi:uncharacterized protein YcbK (DUF882 family)
MPFAKGHTKTLSSRRNFLKLAGGVGVAAATASISNVAQAAIAPVPDMKPAVPDFLNIETRELTFEHSHTGERLTAAYFDGGDYVDDALSAVSYLMRDFRNDQVHDIDPAMLDILAVVHGRLGSTSPIQVISAYRSPETNQALAEAGAGVAKNSYHLYGQAVDVRLADRRAGDIYRVALNLAAGGAGLYARSNFVHIDSGPVRTW